MKEDERYYFSGSEIGSNGYHITLYGSFNKLYLDECAKRPLTDDAVFRVSILKSLGITLDEDVALRHPDDEIGVMKYFEGDDLSFFIAVSDRVASMIKTKSSEYGASSSLYIGDKLLEYLGIECNLRGAK